MIKLGITGGLCSPDPNRNVFSTKQLCYIESDFANYWASFGVMPILIPNLSIETLPSFLAQLDGLVLMGGTDIAPSQYNEAPIGKWQGDALRDNYELTILDWCFKQDYPILGICRGFQLLNVYFGGTLYQDLETQQPSKVKHRDPLTYDLNLHPINLIQGELLDQLKMNRLSTTVNSIHHQGIKKLAPNLTAIAAAEDGLIEAFYHHQKPKGKIIGFQWHPEFFVHAQETLLNDRPVIEHFLSFCSSKYLNPSFVK
ncbi:gamma-glutamyl-gamma-aminobutyrate hydrolase family protein [Aureispira anguillae]|uniref:Gamma-glutamyl-gamma-aminobutyrate hydrolase family protein n=1 Tax=Aureispira anguillae TaxID=2864201 RepID=A0A915YEW7_9BACT|nr:gamma-glutamyl-gamma-aminobutyrate hydrolase family protein [Aureispira anguillae]BDS11731.1 gamma-glutamyl-gamma-aminobutyrate hydrolase family protein [Aureispira anguillae]